MQQGNEGDATTIDFTYHVKDRTVENWESSEAAKSLSRMLENDRIRYIVVITPASACPACQQLAGTYPKDKVPRLPIEYCSEPNGCRSYYLPYLGDLYP